jgi:hypothetical protein
MALSHSVAAQGDMGITRRGVSGDNYRAKLKDWWWVGRYSPSSLCHHGGWDMIHRTVIENRMVVAVYICKRFRLFWLHRHVSADGCRLFNAAPQ